MIESIFIRAETFPNEYRTPLVPNDVKKLIKRGIKVYIQSSQNRFFEDNLYADISGCCVTSTPWTDKQFKHSLILGIKALNDLEKLDEHTHAYFSHTRKGQEGSQKILEAFQRSGSQLYDFEYITDTSGCRLITFGFHAGVVGAALGLQEFSFKITSKPSLQNLQPWPSFLCLLRSIPKVVKPKIAVLGANGRSGRGVTSVLDTLGLKYEVFLKEDAIQGLEDFDIVYNCILLDSSYSNVWFSKATVFSRPIVIVDISCDVSKSNNPIQIYTSTTTWAEPVYCPHPHVSLIAIENLPSLLPTESSSHFSACLFSLLLEFPKGPWSKALSVKI